MWRFEIIAGMFVNLLHLGYFKTDSNLILLIGEAHGKRKDTISVSEILKQHINPQLLDTITYCHEGGSVQPVGIFKKQISIESRNIYTLYSDLVQHREKMGLERPPYLQAENFYNDFNVLFYYLDHKEVINEMEDPLDYSNPLIMSTTYHYQRLRQLNNYFKTKTTTNAPPSTPINEMIFAYSILYNFKNSIIIYHAGASHTECLWDWVRDMGEEYSIQAGLDIIHCTNETIQKPLADVFLTEFNSQCVSFNTTTKAPRRSSSDFLGPESIKADGNRHF